MKAKLLYFLTVIIILSMTASVVMAEDGVLFRKDISKTPDLETEKAALFMMDFYVPAQASTGALVTIDNYEIDECTDDSATELNECAAYDPREYAKPLFSVYIDGPSEHTFYEETGAPVLIDGGIVFGAMDAFVGVSLDDGTTWKTTNLSRSAEESSINVSLPDPRAYPGHVHNVVHQVFGDNILVAWVSKYCESGSPLYSLTPDEDTEVSELDAALYFADLEETYGKDAVYLYDLFGVGGKQGIVDYTEQGWEDIGEVPFSCVWTSRGKLLAADDPSTTDVVETLHTMWTKPERLTSGKRDANLPVVDCAAGAGCMLTWQEDPEGLRPGQGLGPGEGWSGAVAWQETDIWYSHISQADFDIVFSEDSVDTTLEMTMAEYAAALYTNQAKPYVPMAMPVRLTDNAKCKGVSSTTDVTKQEDPYCYIDFDSIDDIDYDNVSTLTSLIEPEADADFCASTIDVETSGGGTIEVCVTDDNRLLEGQLAATRVRMNFKPYTKADGTKSAWIVMAAEESKAMGDVVDPVTLEPIDIGKDVWYYSFDPFKTGADEFMVGQGGMLNQPAQCNFDAGLDDPLCTGLEEGDFYPVQVDTITDRGYEYYLTEIARRFALTTNSVADAVASESGLSAMLIYKQGIINQGGPADIMLRRVVIPDDFDPLVDNPYAFENMECTEWLYTEGENPNYLQGLCMSPAINITGTTIVTCDPDQSDSAACADLWPLNDDGSNNVPGDFPKIYEWRQCDGVASIDGCEDDNDLDDQVWENPFDVAKGHRGFLDKDFVMIMYAWAPNWNSNTVGNDHYNLYARRSFDGGLTWTTTPAGLGGEGVTYFEYYYDGNIGTPLEQEWTYGPGEFEQGRNVSLLTGNKITILDPRYSPTGGMKLYSTIKTDWLTANGFTFTGLPYDDDLARDPSKFFMIYETGDNTTVAVGEATPLDLYYSRATVYGDVWEVMDYTTTTDDLLLDRWPWVENKAEILSGEASMLANPGGTFMYAVWNQWQEETISYPDPIYPEIIHTEDLVFNSDIMFRRFMYVWDGDLTARAPIASLLYTGPVMYDVADDTITFAATGRDLDNVGDGEDIVEYEFVFFTPDGYRVVLEDCNLSNKQICKMPTRTLSEGWAAWQTGQTGKPGTGVGWASMGVHVKDNDAVGTTGIVQKESKLVSKDIYLATLVYTTRLPVIMR